EFKERYSDYPVADKTLRKPGVGDHLYATYNNGGYLVRLYNFPVGSPHLALGMKDILADVAAWLLKAPERNVWVIGYAEVGEGTTVHNKSLSLQRAQSVWRQLAAFKVPKTQLVDIHGGVMGGGDVVSQTAKEDTTREYDPGRFRTVDVELQSNNITRMM